MTKVIIKAADGTGAVEAFHNANKKLETTSTGIAITGDVDVTDAVAEVTVKSTDASAAKLFFNGHGVTAADFGLGHIGGQWNGNDVANIRLESGDDTTNKDDGRIVFSTSDASSTPDERMRIEPNGNVNIGCNTSANPFTYLRFGASQHGAADIRPTDDGSHTVGLSFYIDSTGDSTINPTEAVKIGADGDVRVTRGAIKVTHDYSDSHYSPSTQPWSYFQHGSAGHSGFVLENSADTQPYGMFIYFSDAAPDNNTENFLQCSDSAAVRFRLYSDGDVWTVDAGTLTSDETLKENVTDATSKLEDLKKIKVRNFNWKSSFAPEKSKKKQIGFIAQEVEQVFPSLISEHDIAVGGAPNDDDHTPVMKKAIKQAWAPILVKALQELTAKVETLETEVAALKAG